MRSMEMDPQLDPYEDDEDSVWAMLLVLGLVALLAWGCLFAAGKWAAAHADQVPTCEEHVWKGCPRR